MNDKKWTNKSEDFWVDIIKQIENGAKASELADENKISRAAISYQLKKRKVPYKSLSGRKYFFNENYFNHIDSENKAYWLGFITADGSVSRAVKGREPNRLIIRLSSIDSNHLYKFKKEMDTKSEIKFYMPHKNTFGTNEMCELTFNSAILACDLSKYGVVPNKFDTCYLPNIDKSLLKHFIRGFFDGDGSVYQSGFYADGKNKVRVSFSKNKIILNQILKHLRENIPDFSSKISVIPAGSNKNSSILQIAGKKDVSSFYDFLYKDSSVYLDRKYNKFTSLLSQ